MFTADKLKKMDERMTFVLGYRNLYNLVCIFIAAVLIVLASWSSEGTIIGWLMLVLGTKWLYDQMMKNIDDLECQDLLDKKDGP